MSKIIDFKQFVSKVSIKEAIKETIGGLAETQYAPKFDEVESSDEYECKIRNNDGMITIERPKDVIRKEHVGLDFNHNTYASNSEAMEIL